MIEGLKMRWQLARSAFYDYRRYAKHSFVFGGQTREHRRAIIRILTHYLEGGMSFPDVRLGYGQEKAHSILSKLGPYIDANGADETVQWAVNTLRSYVQYHRERGMELADVETGLSALKERIERAPSIPGGGADIVTRKDIQAAVDFDFSAFIRSRHSVRQYTDQPLDEAMIRRIVTHAQECPNVCNRQTCRVYAVNNYEDVQDLLTYQAGNAGFRPEIRTLFVVTSNMEHMNLIGERFQGWIDGGIFAMTLALSIHAEGLGACFLNWSVERDQDLALRRRMGIPDNELVITMMSAGHLKPEFRVPVSKRKPVDDILTINPDLV